MADTKISALAANTITGTEEVPVAKAGSNFKNSLDEIQSWLIGQSFNTVPITVDAATTAALTGTYTYNNGAAGVGATLTRTTNGAFQTVDGVAAALNNRYLIKNYTGANRLRNGVYSLTQVGTAGTPAILTRATDSDESSELNDQVVIPSGGSVNGRRVFSQTFANPTVGTSNIAYVAASAGGGNIRSDGSVDFTATETWDDNSGNTIAISPASIVAQDGGVTGTTTIGPNSAVLTDGTGITTIIGATIVTDGGGGVITGTMSSGGIQFSDSGSSVSGLFTTTTLTLGTATETLTLVSNSVACDSTLRIRTTANNGDINLDPNGTGKITCTKDIAFSDKVIDTTAGDSATINSPNGRFRKDTSGTTFTLTNSYITADSVILLTAANNAIDASATSWTVSAGVGSATITFNAAPTSNFDMNFVIFN